MQSKSAVGGAVVVGFHSQSVKSEAAFVGLTRNFDGEAGDDHLQVCGSADRSRDPLRRPLRKYIHVICIMVRRS